MGMAKSPHRAKNDKIELHPDAWERFTEFVKRIAKAGPQHRSAQKMKEPIAKKARPKNQNPEA
jgi:hypothetical protein